MALVLQLMLLLLRHLMMNLALQKRNRKLVIAVPVVWERRVEEIRVVVVGVEAIFVVVMVVVVVAADKVASVVVIDVAGVVVALAVAGMGAAVVVAAALRVPATLLREMMIMMKSLRQYIVS